MDTIQTPHQHHGASTQKAVRICCVVLKKLSGNIKGIKSNNVLALFIFSNRLLHDMSIIHSSFFLRATTIVCIYRYANCLLGPFENHIQLYAAVLLILMKMLYSKMKLDFCMYIC